MGRQEGKRAELSKIVMWTRYPSAEQREAEELESIETLASLEKTRQAGGGWDREKITTTKCSSKKEKKKKIEKSGRRVSGECEATCSNISQSRAQLSSWGANDFRLRYSAVAFGERLAPTRVRFIYFVLPAVYFVLFFFFFFFFLLLGYCRCVYSSLPFFPSPLWGVFSS